MVENKIGVPEPHYAAQEEVTPRTRKLRGRLFGENSPVGGELLCPRRER